MSTILDALKRLEDEHHKEKMRKPPSGLSGETVARFRVRRRTMALMLAALTAIGGAGAFLWIEKGPSEAVYNQVKHRPEQAAVRSSLPVPASPDNRSHRLKQQAKGIATKAKADHRPAPIQPAKREEIAAAEAAAPGTVSPTYSKAFQTRQKTRQSPQEYPHKAIRHHNAPGYQGTPHAPNKSRTGGAPSMSVPLTGAKQDGPPPRQTGLKPSPSKPEAARQKNAVPQPASNQDPYADVETLPRGTLKLQAISWSNVPGARITIIDDRILHEGQNIGDYTVTQIRPEDIILNKAGQHWKLGYSNR